jgi:hypothetical protein
MNTLLIFIWIYGAMIAMAFWESAVEGRNSWSKKKYGWDIKIGKFTVLTSYHFYLFAIMLPLLVSLPLVINGWDTVLFGILVSALTSGMIIEDFVWYIVNPKVKFKEFWSTFSDYYPWIRIGKKKIIPVGYVINAIIAVLSWVFLWK